MKIKFTLLLCHAVAYLFLATSASAAVIFTENFENPDISGDSTKDPTGWIDQYGGGGRLSETSKWNPPVAYGPQIFNIWTTTSFNGTKFLTTGSSILPQTIVSGDQYDLSVAIGVRTDRSALTGILRLVAIDDGNGGAITVIATTSGTPTVDTFTESLSVTGTVDNALAGQRYAVQLGATGAAQHIGFDHVVLDITAVPEPTTAALFGMMGSLALLRRRRRGR